MKLLTVAIPCYNSEEYMDHAIESLLEAKEDLEIIIVDDGSTDRTPEIADQYAKMYPDTIRVIHQENGGHGAAVTTGIKNATGLYYKVLDSDDWLDQDGLRKVIARLKSLREPVDMFIVNYVYDKPSANRHKPIRYRNCLPLNKVFHWYDIRPFLPSQNLLMHSVIYRLGVLQDCNLELPKHTFYVDNLFVYEPLPYVHTMYYMNANLYHYYIGREGQSVNEEVMIKRIDQQLAVNKRMIDTVDIMQLDSHALRYYMIHYLSMIMTVTTVLLTKSGTPENMDKREELWNYLERKQPHVYRSIRRTALGNAMRIHGRGNKVLLLLYKIAQKIFQFN